MHTKGTTSTQGIGCLRLGNDQAALIAGSAKGRLTLYSNNQKYSALQSRDDITNSGFVYLPAPESANDNQYLIWSPNAATAIGSGTKPVYISAAGKAIASSSTVGSDALPIYMNAGTLTACTASSVFSDFSSSPSASGETLSITVAGQKRTVTLDAATTEQGGIVTTSGQSFAGAKTFTGNLIMKNATEYPILYFQPSLGTSAMGAIQNGTEFSNDVITSNRMYMVEWSYTSNSATRLNKYELYAFPEVDPDRTTNQTYYVLTTKPSINTYTMNSLRLTNTQDADVGSDNGTALIIGPRTGTHLTIDNNEIIAKSNGTTGGTLSLNLGDGGLVQIGAGGLKVNGDISVTDTISSTSTLYINSANNTSIIFSNGSTEAGRFNPSGCFNIDSNQTSDTYGLYVNKASMFKKNAYFQGNIWANNGTIGGSVVFLPTRSTDGKATGVIQYYACNSTSATAYNLGSFYFSCYSYAKNTYNRVEYYDRYCFPAVDADKTKNDDYVILTTKNTITVEQGGTGVTSKDKIAAGLLYNVTTTNPTSYSRYNLIFIGSGNAESVATTSYVPRTNMDFNARLLQGTADTTGYAILELGNSTASGTAGNKYGSILLYSSNTGYAVLAAGATTGNSTHYLPTTGGTLLNSSGGSIDHLTITSTDGISHILFSRTSHNYLRAPAGGTIALCVNDTLAIDKSALVVEASSIHPGKNTGATLGTSTTRWGALYATSGNFSGSITAATGMYLKNDNLVKGTAPSESTGCVISFCEGAGVAAKNRIGMIYSYVTTSNVAVTRMYAYKPEKDSTSTAYLYTQYAADGTTKTGSSTEFTATKVHGAVWNDYAEFRNQDEKIEPGYCVTSSKNGKVYKTTKRMQYCEGIVSDTFGFSIGETENCKTPLAVTGRVLAFYNGDIDNYNIGDVVCAGANGKIEKMTREEIKNYPDRIVGTVSEFPSYETWGDGNVPTANRIWIKVK